MNRKEKKALSPVIATVLLVSLALVLAVIIFFWARSFTSEKISKGDRAIENACADVVFQAEAFFEGGSGFLSIVNEGNVPIYSIEISKKQFVGEITGVEVLDNLGLKTGQTARVGLPDGIASGDEILIVPILLGETETHKKTHVCEEDYAKELTVQ